MNLASRIAELESQKEELEYKLNRIQNNALWKASKPVRNSLHLCIRQLDRIRNCGGIKGVFAKLAYKKREKKAMQLFGTDSFPDAQRIEMERSAKFPSMVKISILVPLYNTPKNFLEEMITSVMNQTYVNWELCLADGSDAEHSYVEDICVGFSKNTQGQDAHGQDAHGQDAQGHFGHGRIVYKRLDKNEGIAGNTNQCYQLATGEYIALFDHDDILHPSALYEYVKAINEQKADYLYCDETTFHNGDINKMLTMHFKPDFAPDNLRANNYICHFSMFSRELLVGTELFRTKFDGSQDHDMILRLTQNAKNVVHIPRLLYYWRSHAGSVASDISAKPYAIMAAKNAVADHLKNQGFEDFKITSTRAFETIFKIRYQILDNPKISIVIANKDHKRDLERCLNSIFEKSTYDNYEIIIVENNSTTEEIFEYYREILGEKYTKEGAVSSSENGKIKVVYFEGVFNYAKVNNVGVAHSNGDYILLLNNDTEVITVNWMEELLMYAQREDVGAVGAKLFYEDKTIQHAGVVLGLGAHRTAGHSHYKQHRNNLGYMGRLCYTQNVSAVTGACLMVKRKHFDMVGGLEESFAVSLNDVDFCLKLREKNLLNIFTPFAELYHYESISRGADDSGEKAERYNRESKAFREKWRTILEQGDPYYNVNFSLDKSDFSLKIE